MEKFLKKIAKSQEFGPDDRLSAMIDRYSSEELSLDDLDNVYAARKADFQDFLNTSGIGEDKK